MICLFNVASESTMSVSCAAFFPFSSIFHLIIFSLFYSLFYSICILDTYYISASLHHAFIIISLKHCNVYSIVYEDAKRIAKGVKAPGQP